MSDRPTRRAPPGWYAEQGRSGYRYWDGRAWAGSRAVTGAEYSGSLPVMGIGPRSRPADPQERAGLVLLGAALGLLTAGLVLPWAEADTGDLGVLDGDLPWLVGAGMVADSWLLILLGALLLRALLVAVVRGSDRRVQQIAVVVGLAVMGFCVAEGLTMDADLDEVGARAGLGLFVAYSGGASAAVSGVLLGRGR